MNAKHTPGPWNQQRNVTNYRSGRKALEVRGASDELIATFPGCDRDAANARLIAAAPELFDARRIFIGAAFPVSTEINERGHNWSEVYLDQALEIARRAIAKATGEQS